MKNLFSLLAALALLTSPAHAKLNVVASLPDFASLAEEIGGDKVKVTSLAKGTEDPHFVDAKPSFIRVLNQADVLLQGGADLESGWLPPLVQNARNPRILPGAPGHVVLARGCVEPPAHLLAAVGPDAEVDHAGAGRVRGGGQPGDRLDAERGAEREQQVGRLGRRERTGEVRLIELLAERDRVALEEVAAARAVRIGLAGAHAHERVLHRGSVGAAQALHPVGGAVHLDHPVRVRAGALVQPVDVLGHEQREARDIGQVDERTVPVVRLDVPHAVRGAGMPVATAQLRVGSVVPDVRGPLGVGVAGPEPVGSAEVRDPRLGRDPRAGEHHDRPGIAQPPRDLLEGHRIEGGGVRRVHGGSTVPARRRSNGGVRGHRR